MRLFLKCPISQAASSAVLICQLAAAPDAQAHVFASHLQLGGTNANLTTTPGDSVTIDYLLNQHADAGVTVSLVSGTNLLWTTNLIATGTNQGFNSIAWNGKDALGNTASNGLWHVKVVASSVGRTNWWKIPMADNHLLAHNGDGYAWAPWGIAVNNNTNSPYFGRIFVGNAVNSGKTNEAGDLKGIGIYTAHGSYATSSGHSTGGWDWNEGFGFDQSPGKIEVDADDRVYVVDGTGHQATVLSFDQSISHHSPPAFALNNDALFEATPSDFSGLLVTGSGTNRALLMTDTHNGDPGGLGVRRWSLDASGMADTNDAGTTIVAAGGGCALDFFPQDLTMDGNGRIYAIQNLPSFASSARILAFNPYQGTPLTNAAWQIFPSLTNGLDDAFGISAALHTNWIAVACNVDNGLPIAVYEVSETNAVLLTVNGDGLNITSESEHEYTDVAWDRAGNLYVTDTFYGFWRVFSPPGSNTFTTLSLQSIKVGPYTAPVLTANAWKTNQFQVQLNKCEIGVSYALESSSNLVAWSAMVTNKAPSTNINWTVPSSTPRGFFRARVVP